MFVDISRVHGGDAPIRLDDNRVHMESDRNTLIVGVSALLAALVGLLTGGLLGGIVSGLLGGIVGGLVGVLCGAIVGGVCGMAIVLILEIDERLKAVESRLDMDE